jgi:hypothetical protein
MYVVSVAGPKMYFASDEALEASIGSARTPSSTRRSGWSGTASSTNPAPPPVSSTMRSSLHKVDLRPTDAEPTYSGPSCGREGVAGRVERRTLAGSGASPPPRTPSASVR